MDYHHATKTLLKIEENARKFFERIPFLHALLAGLGVVLFWRGTWESADKIGLEPLASLLLGIALLGGIGLFIQTFVGNTIIIKSVKKEEALEKSTVKKVEAGETTLLQLSQKIDELNSKIDNLNK